MIEDLTPSDMYGIVLAGVVGQVPLDSYDRLGGINHSLDRLFECLFAWSQMVDHLIQRDVCLFKRHDFRLEIYLSLCLVLPEFLQFNGRLCIGLS